jgi:hypothetical protein
LIARADTVDMERDGTAGNEQLTAITGVLLIVLLAVLGVTILRIGQLIWVHLFLGLVLIGPVLLKLASTGYRFVRYYAGNPTYRRKGPPPPWMRIIAPVVVLCTVVVFVSGVVLMYNGPSDRGTWLTIHKTGFFVWLAFTAFHVLGHMPGLGGTVRDAGVGSRSGAAGATGRWIALASAVVGGLVLALLLVPQFAAWTAPGAMVHHHGG